MQLIQSDAVLRRPLQREGHPGRFQQVRCRGGRNGPAPSQGRTADEPTEIVIHVNMLKEGWDVTNLYTIVPLARRQCTDFDRAIDRPRPAPPVRPTYRRFGRGSTEHRRARPVSGDYRRGEQPDSVIRLQHVILDPSRDASENGDGDFPVEHCRASGTPSSTVTITGAPTPFPARPFSLRRPRRLSPKLPTRLSNNTKCCRVPHP